MRLADGSWPSPRFWKGVFYSPKRRTRADDAQSRAKKSRQRRVPIAKMGAPGLIGGEEMSDAAHACDTIRRAAAGDRAALERLLLDHYEPLVAKIAHRLPSSLQSIVAVDDIVQQTYSKVFRCVADFEPRSDDSFL